MYNVRGRATLEGKCVNKEIDMLCYNQGWDVYHTYFGVQYFNQKMNVQIFFSTKTYNNNCGVLQ